MNQDFLDIQQSLVTTIVGEIREPWVRIVVNYEMEYSSAGVSFNRVGFYICKKRKGTYEEMDLNFSKPIQDLFYKLNDCSVKVNKEHWGTCDLVIDKNGKFTFDFSYDPPKRINGILDYESFDRFNDYLDTFSEE